MARCDDCGFLAEKNPDSNRLEEIDEERRQKGHAGHGITIGSSGTYETAFVPICFARAHNLKFEIRDEERHPESTLSVINKERVCEQFYKWQMGFSPKEHREMIDRESRLEWQTKREDADKKWREQQEARHSKEEWHRYIFLGIFTIVAGAVGVVLGHFWK